MKTVLVVEDHEANRRLVTRFLTREGYNVLVAEDGLQGVALALSDQPDMILMDLDLPELDGWEATRRIKANPETKHIPVVALTSHAFPDDVAKARKAGCDGYETKPIVYSRLMQRVEQILRGGA